MKRIAMSLLLGLLVTLTACNGAVDKPTGSPTPVPTTTTSAVPSPTAPQPTASAIPAPEWGELADTFVQTHPDHPDVVLLEGSFSLPYIENADGVDPYAAFNAWYEQLLTDLKDDLKAEVAQALDDYETTTALGDTFTPSTVEHDFEVMYHTETTCAVLRTHYGFSGGPYPTLLYMADCFDMTTGAFLKFENFFADPDKAAEIILNHIIGVAGSVSSVQYDMNAVASAFNREYFYPTAEGFVFYYQPQILNPQAATKPEFLVPYSLLEGLLSR